MATIQQHYKYNYTATWIYKEFAVPNSRLKNAIPNGKGLSCCSTHDPKQSDDSKGFLWFYLTALLTKPCCSTGFFHPKNEGSLTISMAAVFERWQDPEIYQWLMDSGFLDLQMQGMKKILQKLQIQTPPWTFVSWLPRLPKKWRSKGMQRFSEAALNGLPPLVH